MLKRRQSKQVLKILLPHVSLIAVFVGYLIGGASLLVQMERDNDVAKRNEKMVKIRKLEEEIVHVPVEFCLHNPNYTIEVVTQRVAKLVKLISSTYEQQDENITRWTYSAGVLYALTVITTTGYDRVSPQTRAGRLVTVFYGLLGIPLMFITVADIGKFLSAMVVFAYKKMTICGHRVRRKLPKLPFLKTKRTTHDGKRRINSLSQMHVNGIDLPAVTEEKNGVPVELPFVTYFVLILVYCVVGSILFKSFGNGSEWAFIYGFFFAFNAITTIGLGNIAVEDRFYLILTVTYMVVGLSLITMCIDLASAYLKLAFMKLHYFGRKFRGAGLTILNMSDDIKEAIRIVNALRAFHPSKEKFTVEDFKQYLESERRSALKPFIPNLIDYIEWIDADSYTSTLSLSMLVVAETINVPHFRRVNIFRDTHALGKHSPF